MLHLSTSLQRIESNSWIWPRQLRASNSRQLLYYYNSINLPCQCIWYIPRKPIFLHWKEFDSIDGCPVSWVYKKSTESNTSNGRILWYVNYRNARLKWAWDSGFLKAFRWCWGARLTSHTWDNKGLESLFWGLSGAYSTLLLHNISDM